MKKLLSRAMLLCIATCVLSAEAAGKDVGLGKQLARRRAEVDDLDARLERIRMEARSQRLSLDTQRSDLEVLLRTERVRRQTLDRVRAKRQSEQQQADEWAEQLRAPGLQAARELRRYVAASLPFQLEARLAAVDQIISDLERADIDPVLSLSKLWQLSEDEIRLTAECGLHRQAVLLAGERQLAEVARLGMAVLYFRLEDGRVGWARPGKHGFTFELFADSARAKAVSALYDALRKQIRQGSFSLPLPPTSKT